MDKTCKVCNENKPFTDFAVDRRCCKKCKNKKDVDRRRKNNDENKPIVLSEEMKSLYILTHKMISVFFEQLSESEMKDKIAVISQEITSLINQDA